MYIVSIGGIINMYHTYVKDGECKCHDILLLYDNNLELINCKKYKVSIL